MTLDTEIRTLAAPELDEVSGGNPFLEIILYGSLAFLVTALSAPVAVKDGKVYVDGLPQN